MEPGRIFHGSIDFGPPSGVMNKFQLVVECKQVFYRVFIISSEATEWQKKYRADHIVTLDKLSHQFLHHDSVIDCSQLHPVKVQAADQHIREKPADLKCKISVAVRDEIVQKVGASKLFPAEDKDSIAKSLARI